MKTIHILKSQVDAILDTDPETRQFTHQALACIALYKLVYPDWEHIQSVDGYPTCNETTQKYIMRKFIEFDRVNHPEVFAGGRWINNGFSSLEGKDLHDWEILPAPVTLDETGRKELATA